MEYFLPLKQRQLLFLTRILYLTPLSEYILQPCFVDDKVMENKLVEYILKRLQKCFILPKQTLFAVPDCAKNKVFFHHKVFEEL